MNAPLRLESAAEAVRGVLRFITAGSVDDGKSTLIGRLLFDCKGILSDQLAALERASSRRAVRPGALDLSLLTDGLEAEREQGITIDVAYRYFATARRKFIIADAPGHEQYTRNMVTGASSADAAIILIDATRVAGGELLAQTRRHSALARLLGIRHIVVAVNKMDALGFDRAAYDVIVAAYAQLAARLGIADFTPIPLSALEGDNVALRSERTPWYAGPTLLEWLEATPSEIDDEAHAHAPLRLAVQTILRGYAPGDGAARGIAGRVASGSLATGDEVLILPGGERARVAQVFAAAAPVARAVAGQAVAVRLDREVDVSRGDWLVAADAPPALARELQVDLAWLDAAPFAARAKLVLRHGTREVLARVKAVEAVLDLATADWRAPAAGETLAANSIARVVIEAQQPLAFEPYERIRGAGALVLIDPASHYTVAAGMIRGALS